MTRYLLRLSFCAAMAGLSACSDPEPQSEYFTGPIPETTAVAQPVENLCPIKTRGAVCIQSWTQTGAKLQGRVGTVNGDSRRASAGSERGVLITGPSAILQPGRYRFTLDYNRTAAPGLNPSEIDKYDIIYIETDEATNKKSIVSLIEETLPEGPNSLVKEVTLKAERNQVQFRVIFGGKSDLTVNRLTVTPLDDRVMPG